MVIHRSVLGVITCSSHDLQCIAFRDITPVAKVHLLVIPREPIPSLSAAGNTDQNVCDVFCAGQGHS